MTSTGCRADRLHASFRDPSGFLFRRDGVLYRQINQSYQTHYDLLLTSGLYNELVGANRIVPHEEVTKPVELSESAYRVIQPRELPFISYPYEWCFSQLKDAALLTLQVLKTAMSRDMVLKDASAYNIQMMDGHPVLIDTLSFERYVEGKPWIAYRQFCQHFLAPLALMSLKDIRLGQLLRCHIDGIPLDLASRLLPARTLATFSLGLHIHAHARSQSRYADRPQQIRRTRSGFSRRSFEGLIDSLKSAVRKLKCPTVRGEWTDYYQSQHNYSDDGLENKEAVLAELLAAVPPGIVWDLGANTGRFSRIARHRASFTVAWDVDPTCVEINYQQVLRDREQDLLPLLLDLTNPSSGTGWANEERTSFMRRGPATTILALGLIHHLAIANNVPLDRIAALLADLCQWLVIEFVPKEDSQVQKMLATREDIFDEYHADGFQAAFSSRFGIEKVVPIDRINRTMYLMKSRNENP